MSTGKRLAFERIKTAVEAQGYFKTFDLFNGQFETEAQGQTNPIKEPALFMEFGEIRWQSRSRKVQQGEGILTFHIGRKWKNQDPARIFDMEEKLTELFQGFEDDHLSLERLEDRQDTSMVEWGLWSVNYAAAFKDEIATPSLNLVDPSLGLSHEVDIVAKFD